MRAWKHRLALCAVLAGGLSAPASAMFELKLPPLPLPPRITAVDIVPGTATEIQVVAHGQPQKKLDIANGGVTHFCDDSVLTNPPLVLQADLFYAFQGPDAGPVTAWQQMPMDLVETPVDPPGCGNDPVKSLFKATVTMATFAPTSDVLKYYVRVQDTSGNVAFTSPGQGAEAVVTDPLGDQAGRTAGEAGPAQTDIQNVSVSLTRDMLRASLKLGGDPKADGGVIEGYLGIFWNGDVPFPGPESTVIPDGVYAVTMAQQNILPDLVHAVWDGACLSKAAASGNISKLLSCHVAANDGKRLAVDTSLPNTLSWTLYASPEMRLTGPSGHLQMAFATGQIDINPAPGSPVFWINDATAGISAYADEVRGAPPVEPLPVPDPGQDPKDPPLPPVIAFPPNEILQAVCALPKSDRLAKLLSVMNISKDMLPPGIDPARFEEKMNALCESAQPPQTCEAQRDVLTSNGIAPDGVILPACGPPPSMCEDKLKDLKERLTLTDCAANADACHHLAFLAQEVASHCNLGDPGVPPVEPPKPEPPQPGTPPGGLCAGIVRNLMQVSKPACDAGQCPDGVTAAPDLVMGLCEALNLPPGVSIPGSDPETGLPNITVDFCKDKPNCVSLSLDLVDAAKNKGAVMPTVTYDIVDAADPNRSCLKPSLGRQASGATLNVRLPLEIDTSRCPETTPVNLVVKDVPKGYSRNSEDNPVFNCVRNVKVSDLSAGQLADCKLATSDTGGDANGDGKVDLVDFGRLKANFSKADAAADFNKDGKIDLKDFGILKKYYGMQY